MTETRSITLSPAQVAGLREVAQKMQEAADRRHEAIEATPIDIALVDRLEHETLTAGYGLLGYVQGAIGR